MFPFSDEYFHEIPFSETKGVLREPDFCMNGGLGWVLSLEGLLKLCWQSWNWSGPRSLSHRPRSRSASELSTRRSGGLGTSTSPKMAGNLGRTQPLNAPPLDPRMEHEEDGSVPARRRRVCRRRDRARAAPGCAGVGARSAPRAASARATSRTRLQQQQQQPSF